MTAKIYGLHHVTAIAGNAGRNYRFYTEVLGLRLVKKTVNFDDPGTYHFYYGNREGEPGTIMTFFPWEGIGRGRPGTGQATSTSFKVPEDSITFWLDRFNEYDVTHNNTSERFEEEVITILDPDGLKLELVASPAEDSRIPWATENIDPEHAIRGLYNVTLTLGEYENTANLLTELFGYEPAAESTNRYRLKNKYTRTADMIDLVALPTGQRGIVAGGSVHHIAFRAADDGEQLELREALLEKGFHATSQLDRNYFKSVYFREPGGVLFEIATDPPGFTADEDIESLGSVLKLPSWLEDGREEIENALPELD